MMAFSFQLTLFTFLFATMAFAESSAMKNLLRGEARKLQDTCPTSLEEAGTMSCMNDGQMCQLNYRWVPKAKDDGSCSGPFTCSSSQGCECDGGTGTWICYSDAQMYCEGGAPGKSFTACTP